jgi:hypothetical protein
LQAIPHRLNVLLIEKHVELRTQRLRDLLAASRELALYGRARFTSHQVKELWGYRKDNGNHIVTVLIAMGAVYPGQFSTKHVGKARRQAKGRPMHLYEISMDESLRRELLHDDADHDESMAVPVHGCVDDYTSLNTVLVRQ